MKKIKLLSCTILLLLTMNLFGGNGISKFDILKKLNINEKHIQKVLPDSTLHKMNTKELFSMILNKNKTYWFGYEDLFVSNLLDYSNQLFFKNITYEIINRMDFNKIVLSLFCNPVHEFSIIPLNLLLSHKFIWNKFSNFQKYKLIKSIYEQNKKEFSKSTELLIVKILENEKIFEVKTRKNNYLDELDILQSGGMNKMLKLLKQYVKAKEVLYKK